MSERRHAIAQLADIYEKRAFTEAEKLVCCLNQKMENLILRADGDPKAMTICERYDWYECVAGAAKSIDDHRQEGDTEEMAANRVGIAALQEMMKAMGLRKRG